MGMPTWTLINNNSYAHNGRIWIRYDPIQAQVQVLDIADQWVHCNVLIDSEFFLWTVTYGSNQAEARKELWHFIKTTSTNISRPWIIQGYFNTTLHSNEKIGGAGFDVNAALDFEDCLLQSSLIEMRTQGLTFTWTNNQNPPERIWSKLDRVVMNLSALETYSGALCTIPERGVSDHSPLLVRLSNFVRGRKRAFKFYDMWLSHPKFDQLVQQAWEIPVHGRSIHKLWMKLKNVKNVLQELNRKEFSQISQRVFDTRQLLGQLQLQQLSDPFNEDLIDEERAINAHYGLLLRQEKEFYRQKARLNWLKLGDANTAFFHNSVKVRNFRNSISSLQLDDGTVIHDQHTIGQNMINFYSQLLGESIPRTQHVEISIIEQGPVLSTTEADGLIIDVTAEEIKTALWGIGEGKAHGIDGFTSKFFKKKWQLLNSDIIASVQDFFNTGRLGKVLNSIISPAQSGFVKGRNIVDNILVAHDLVHGYHRYKDKLMCACKIDLKKAYDSVNWDFLEEMLLHLRFPSRFIKWIMMCVRHVSYSLMINGSIECYFQGKKGLRQGDPLSPMLFVIVLEYLSRSLALVPEFFKFHKGYSRLKINHLAFVDDLFLFSAGDVETIRWFRRKLDIFHNISGLQVNSLKSQIYVSVGPEIDRASIISASGFQEGTLLVKYLGIPLISSRLTKEHCLPLLDKLTVRISGWTVKNLSYAGSEVHGKNVIAWKTACKPKSEGGLGIMDLQLWNTVALGKQIWQILQCKESLWAKWVTHTKLVRLSYWGIRKPPDASNAWRSLLNLRPIFKKHYHYHYQLGEQKKFSFWYDPWVFGRALTDIYPEIEILESDVHKTTKVEDVRRNNEWKLPDPSYVTLAEAWNLIENVQCNDHQNDKIIWVPDKLGEYSLQSAKQALRGKSPVVP